MADVKQISVDGTTVDINVPNGKITHAQMKNGSGFTSGNFASFDSSSDIVDSGIPTNIIPSGASSSDKLIKASQLAAQNAFIATPSVTTYLQVKDAYDAGRQVLCQLDNMLLPLQSITATAAVFSAFDGEAGLVYQEVVGSDNVWQEDTYEYASQDALEAQAVTILQNTETHLTSIQVGNDTPVNVAGEDVVAELYGEDKSREVAINVVGGVPISGATRYQTPFELAAGVYNLSYGGADILPFTYISFHDENGNAVQVANKNGQVTDSIVTSVFATQSPYTFPDGIKSVKLYSGTPSADGVLNFGFESTEPRTGGLVENFENLQDKIPSAASSENQLADKAWVIEQGGGGNIKSLPKMYKTQVEDTDIHSGFWWNGHNDGSSYFYIHFTNLHEGDVIFLRNTDAVVARARFFQAYNGATLVASENDNTSTLSVYCVPAGVDNAYMSFYTQARTEKTYAFHIKWEDSILPIDNGNTSFISEKDTLAANTNIALDEYLENKKEVTIEYYAKFDTFGNVSIGQGKGISNGAWFKVDDTKVEFYLGATETARATENHGLTISEFIHIFISVGNNNRIVVTIATASGVKVLSEQIWAACAGEVAASASMATTDIKLAYSCGALRHDFHLYGDSYISYATDRYPYYLDNTYKCFANMLACGISGGEVSYTLPAFLENMAKKAPKVVIWCLGMNDPDTASAINKSWKNTAEFVKAVCDAYGCELVLATIPNVPSYQHTFKNAFVKDSELRYIDFAKAVGAESAGSSWYTGMLHTDNVHPSELGAKVLAARFVLDVPDAVF